MQPRRDVIWWLWCRGAGYATRTTAGIGALGMLFVGRRRAATAMRCRVLGLVSVDWTARPL